MCNYSITKVINLCLTQKICRTANLAAILRSADRQVFATHISAKLVIKHGGCLIKYRRRPAGPPLSGGILTIGAIARTRYYNISALLLIPTRGHIICAELSQHFPRPLTYPSTTCRYPRARKSGRLAIFLIFIAKCIP